MAINAVAGVERGGERGNKEIFSTDLEITRKWEQSWSKSALCCFTNFSSYLQSNKERGVKGFYSKAK
jgi:hypothetical protein